jgi:hypothetical protein
MTFSNKDDAKSIRKPHEQALEPSKKLIFKQSMKIHIAKVYVPDPATGKTLLRKEEEPYDCTALLAALNGV